MYINKGGSKADTQTLTIDKEVVEVSSPLHRGIQKAGHVGAMFGQFLHLSLVLQTQLRVDHAPVLTVPHKQWNSPGRIGSVFCSVLCCRFTSRGSSVGAYMGQ